MLAAFGLSGPPVRLPGGRGTSWLAGAAVVKPLVMAPAELAWQAGVLARLDGRGDLRVSVPLPTTDGALACGGWTASRHQPGSHRPRRWPDIVVTGQHLHAALGHEPEPSFLRARTDRWAVADRVAFGELALRDVVGTPSSSLGRLALALRPVHGRPQVVHGDLTGNVLFHDRLPPLVIDLSPYWRPPAFASAVVVADALLFEGADAAALGSLLDEVDPQYLLRALVFRAVTDHLARPGPPRPHDDKYVRAAGLATRLAAAD